MLLLLLRMMCVSPVMAAGLTRKRSCWRSWPRSKLIGLLGALLPNLPPDQDDPDVVRLVEVLDRHEATYDFDCLVRRGRENLGRLAAAMRELNARIRTVGVSDEEARRLPVQVDAQTFDKMEISTWRTDAGAIDVLTDIAARDGHRLHHEDLVGGSELIEAPGFMIRAAGLSEIIASKEWADRPKDHEALEELRTIRASRVDPPGRRRV